ncbi:MAG: transcription antitermination factor NusB [Lachnospiraceae bacterium]
MNRRKLREELFKLLFRIEFNNEEEMKEQCKLFFQTGEIIIEAIDEEQILSKYNCIKEKLEEIDKMINEKATKWSTTRMSKVDLTIIRLAVFEMMYDESVPESVAINEAVELAKKFGQDESAGFINGVLAKFAS